MVRFKTNEGRSGRLRKTDFAVGDISFQTFSENSQRCCGALIFHPANNSRSSAGFTVAAPEPAV